MEADAGEMINGGENMSDHFELKDGEEVLQEDKALIVGRWFMGKGGKLILTNHRLLFTNRKNGAIKDAHELKNILSVEKTNRLSILSAPLGFLGGFLLLGPLGGLAFLVIGVSILLFLKSVRITSKGRDPIRYGVGPQWVNMIEEQRKAAS